MTHQIYPSTGYGPRMKLTFTGDEQDYDILEVRFLGYMALQGLKETIVPSSTTVDSTKNEKNIRITCHTARRKVIIHDYD